MLLVVCFLLLQVRAAGAGPGARLLPLLNLAQLLELAAPETAGRIEKQQMHCSHCVAAARSMGLADAVPAVLLLKQWPLNTHGPWCC